MRKTETPLGLLREFVGTMHDIAARRDREHEERLHIPPRRTDPVQAVPFANERIPDVELAAMIELMETEGISLQEAACRFHRPWHMVLLSMADYDPQFRRFIQQRRAG